MGDADRTGEFQYGLGSGGERGVWIGMALKDQLLLRAAKLSVGGRTTVHEVYCLRRGI